MAWRSHLLFAAAVAVGGCVPDNGTTAPSTGAPEPAGSNPAASASPSAPSPDELCAHILTVSHRDLGHLDEFDPQAEREAVARCVQTAKADVERYGPVFDSLARCVLGAETLVSIGACEDEYSELLTGGKGDAAKALSLDEAVVGEEVCAHMLHVTHAESLDPEARKSALTQCEANWQALRVEYGNRVAEEVATCAMGSETKDAMDACAEEAAALKEAHEKAAEGTVDPKAALAGIEKLRDEMCACSTASCAANVALGLDHWTEEFPHLWELADDVVAPIDAAAGEMAECAGKATAAK